MFRYPDHEELFAFLDLFTAKLARVELSNIHFLKEKDHTIQTHLMKMNQVFEEDPHGRGEKEKEMEHFESMNIKYEHEEEDEGWWKLPESERKKREEKGE